MLGDDFHFSNAFAATGKALNVTSLRHSGIRITANDFSLSY